MIDAEVQRRALTLFEAFLRHAREAGHQVHAAAVSQPPPRAAIADEEGWDGPTVERPPIVVNLPTAGAERRAAPSDATNPEVRLPPDEPTMSDREPEQSIIVEDDTLTDPSFARGIFPLNAQVPKAIAPKSDPPSESGSTSPLRGRPAEEPTPGAPTATLDVLLQEMSVLVKYGHAEQVAQELDRWLVGRSDDASAMRVGEFELTRIDRERGIVRIAGCVQRMLDRGDARGARGAMATLRRAAGDDPRVRALGLRVGRA